MTNAPKFKRRSDARPDEILDAALTLFVKHGFAQTTVDRIARAADLSKGAVYLYFPSKEALLEGLVRRAVSPLAAHAASELDAGRDHPRETLERVLGSLADAISDERTVAVPMLVIREAANVPAIARIYRDEVLAHVLPALSGLIDDARQQGLIRDVDPDLTVRTIIGPVIAHLLMARVFGITPEGGLALDRLIENHLDIVFNGLEPRESS